MNWFNDLIVVGLGVYILLLQRKIRLLEIELAQIRAGQKGGK